MELYDFIIVMMKEISENRLWEYYLHKSTFSSMSYAEFKEEQEFSSSQIYTPPEVSDKTRKYAEVIVDLIPSEEVTK